MNEAVVMYSGVREVESFNYTISHGASPGVMSFQIVPQPIGTIAAYGTLVMMYGGRRVEMRGCLSDSASYSFNESGEVIGFFAKDWRWKWDFSYVNAAFNLKDYNNEPLILLNSEKADPKRLFINSKRSLPEIIRYVCQQAGVSKFDVSEVPGDVYPEVEWENVPVSAALHELTDKYNIGICPRFDGSVKFAKLGKGISLPMNEFLESMGEELNPPDTPRELELCTLPVNFNVDFPLEAVGFELDGSIKPIDELSYKPSGGWDLEDPAAGFAAAELDEAKKWTIAHLAESCIFKMWRIKLPEKVSSVYKIYVNGGHGEIRCIEQFLPLLDVQAESAINEFKRVRVAKEAIVWGKFCNHGDISDLSSEDADFDDPGLRKSLEDVSADNPEGSPLVLRHIQFQLDTDRGIVYFDEPVKSYVSNDDATLETPVLYLRTGCNIRELSNGIRWRKKKKVSVDKNSPAEKMVVEVPEAQPVHGIITENDNTKEIEKIMSDTLKILSDIFTPKPAHNATYVGWLDFPLDGAIRSVGWSLGPGGSTTIVQRNSLSETNLSISQTRKRLALESIIAKQKADREEAIRIRKKRAGEVKTIS